MPAFMEAPICLRSAPQSTEQERVVSARGPHSDGIGYTFNAGGNQGGEGNDAGEEWFLTNIMEELDAPNEFFYDADAQLLYFFANVSAELHGAAAGQAAAPDSRASHEEDDGQ